MSVPSVGLLTLESLNDCKLAGNATPKLSPNHATFKKLKALNEKTRTCMTRNVADTVRENGKEGRKGVSLVVRDLEL